MPACDAVMAQVPVPLRVTPVDETPFPSIDGLPTEQGPDALKLTSSPFGGFGLTFDTAVAVTVSCEVEINTELGNEPRTID